MCANQNLVKNRTPFITQCPCVCDSILQSLKSGHYSKALHNIDLNLKVYHCNAAVVKGGLTIVECNGYKMHYIIQLRKKCAICYSNNSINLN